MRARLRIVATGAGGFIGRRLIGRLADHDVIAIDSAASSIPVLPHVNAKIGDIADEGLIETVFHGGCDAVVHRLTDGVAQRPGQACAATTKQQIAQKSGYSAPPKFHIHLPAETRQLAHAATSKKTPVSTAT